MSVALDANATEQRIAEAWLAGIRHGRECKGCPLCEPEPEQTLAESVKP